LPITEKSNNDKLMTNLRQNSSE